MSKPSQDNKLVSRTAPQIVERVKKLAFDLQIRKIKFRDRQISQEAVVAAMVLEVLEMGDDLAKAIVEKRLPEIERLFVEAGMTDEEAKGVGITPLDPPSLPLPGPKKGRRKSR